MGSPVDLTLGRSSSESQAVPSRGNVNHDDQGGSSTYPSDHLREVAQEKLRILKEERQKVEGFKRELPLCIQLLDDAIKAAEEKLARSKDIVLPTALRLSRNLQKDTVEALSPESRRPTLEEFMPLKRCEEGDLPSDISSDGELERAEGHCGRTNSSNQPPWMTETRLWNPIASRSTEFVRDEVTRDTGQSEQEQSSVTSSQQQRPSRAGAFTPFQTPHPKSVVSRPQARSGGFCADLNLCLQGARPSTALQASEVEVGSNEAAAGPSPPPPPAPDAQIVKDVENFSSGGNSSSSTRKARRCWSPELHRRFVSALNQLGGSHIATPKQLRELMKVDGLTNDEVKSHLQKYRLHTRRPSSSPSPHPSTASAPPGAPQQLVVVGGIWMPPQHAAAATSQAGSQSGVSDPSQFCHSASLPLDYFAACIKNVTPAATGPAPMQVLQMHRQPIFETPPQAVGTSQSQTSPQGPLQVTSQLSGATQGSSSDTSESGEEEAKSKSTSWTLCRLGDSSPTTTGVQTSEPAKMMKLNVKMHEQGYAVPPQALHATGEGN